MCVWGLGEGERKSERRADEWRKGKGESGVLRRGIRGERNRGLHSEERK